MTIGRHVHRTKFINAVQGAGFEIVSNESLTSSNGGAQTLGPSQPMQHHFLMSTFPLPDKCEYCNQLMIGVIRQGVQCHSKASLLRIVVGTETDGPL